MAPRRPRLSSICLAVGLLGSTAHAQEVEVVAPPAWRLPGDDAPPVASTLPMTPAPPPVAIPAAPQAPSAPSPDAPASSAAPPKAVPLPAATPTPEQLPAPELSEAARGPDAATSSSKPASSLPVQTRQPVVNPAPSPPLLGPEEAPPAEALTDSAALHDDLWARVRTNFGVAPLDTELVRKWEQYYLSRPDYLKRMFERGERYLYHIVEEVTKRGMPTELALLPFVESAFNPHAQSSARASGIWQFMPATGRHFDLRQNVFRDDRRSVLDSTRAALDYLQQLYGTFGDWHLALAAYNWGQGNVSRAVAAGRRQGRGASYLDLAMPGETRNYVPKLQAITNLVARPEQYGLELPALENHPYFLSVTVERDIDVELAARLAGVSIEDFQALNPQLSKPVILAAATPQILLPFENARRYRREVAVYSGSLASWTAWVAPRTLNTRDAARATGMSEPQLREVNRIPPRMLIKAGSTLLVPRRPSQVNDVSERVADTASLSLASEAPAGRKRLVKVGPRGETVEALARRNRVSAAQLAAWNGVAAAHTFRPGQQVVVYLKATGGRPASASAVRTVKATGKTPARKPAPSAARAQTRAPRSVDVAKR